MARPERHLETYFAFLESAALLEALVAEQLRRDGDLSPTQFGLLGRLVRAGGEPVRMSDLADSAVHSRSGLTYQVQLLVEKGLIARLRSETDERSVLVSLTPAGEALVDRVLPGHRDVVDRAFFDAMTGDQIDELGRLVGDLRTRLRSAVPARQRSRRSSVTDRTGSGSV